jgi:RecA-family ATPase
MDGFMEAAYAPPRFILDQLIPRNEVTLGGGHGGSGKSILFLAIAAHVACGKGWDRFDVEQCPVVFISLEDHADHVMYRLQKIIKTYLLDPAAVARNLQVFDGTAAPELMIEVNEFGTRHLMPTQMMQEVEAAVAGAAAGLVILDNASDAYGGNENERRSVRTFIRHLAGIARQNDAALVLLAHLDKEAARNGGRGNNYSGSTAWHNSTRSRLALLEVDGQFQLHHEKHNRSQRADPVLLMWTEDGVLMPGKSGTAAAARERQAASDADAALLAMRAAQSLDIRVPAVEAGPATSWSTISHVPEMATFRGKEGKRRFHSALLVLFADGLLIRQDFKTDQRKKRVAWELTAKGEAAASRIAL